MKLRLLEYLILFALVVVIMGCKQDYTPKPRAYYRIDLPKKGVSATVRRLSV